ncbi:carbohydrate ABC transporter membrane protein 1 (CUT1 family) [Stackebrandtia albiflava]|uniref:Maltose/maltodextrin transport system permease protein n=1 Tax=Stackebrandtia albiflava TaxID=406432 RepID=A0A562UY55_9ACTN|nr:ABC transporter permease subunit [Stackebrandtia albiflava]TWJ10545.1 carbohydrate ABC transporter membrane protein 1 (CUT1 family) [Stackebrandtia albiflava]
MSTRPPLSGVSGQLVKILVLSVVAALAIWAATPLVHAGAWVGLGVVVAVTALVFYVYLSPRRLPAKYLLPGTLLLITFQILPVLLTITTSVTNYGDGHRGDKADAIAAIQAAAVKEVPGSPRYLLSAAWRGENATDGELVFLLTEPGSGEYLVGDAEGLEPLDPGGLTVDPEGRIVAAEGYTVMTPAEFNAHSERITGFAVPTEDGGIRSTGFDAYEGVSTRTYDESCDCITDSETGDVFVADNENGYFVTETGDRIRQGWQVNVGLDNFTRFFTDPDVRGPFTSIFLWNMMFAVCSVLFTFVLGLLCAMAMNHDRIRGKTLYRVLMVLPYAMPSFAMLLVWRDMFNADYGLLNQLLGLELDWFGETWTSRAAVLLVNTWLGYPYMFLICTGALQALPRDTLEAARIDGATGFQAFRKITLPLLLVALTPLLISSFAFNFNNFNAIQLTSGGHPFPDASPQTGDTDLLITYTFRLAFNGSGVDYGYAAAVSMFIFTIVAVISGISFARTRKQEEVYR